MISYKYYLRATIILAILCLIVTGIYITFSALNILDRSDAVAITFAIITPTLYVVTALAFSRYASTYTTQKHLISENKYNFGREIYIFNSYLFSNRVKYLMKQRRYKGQQNNLIAFTATNQVVSRNFSRNDIVTSFAANIAEYLNDIFSIKNEFDKTPYAYCFYHGVFLLFIIGDDANIEKIINSIENNLYQIAKDNQFNIYVQPFFGITKIDEYSDDDFIVYINQALTARNNSERKFETISYFNSSFVKETSMSEVDEIRQGIANEEFVVYYQPKFSLNEQRFISSEALIRWNSSKYGLLPPSKFIEAAENSGLIHMIDEYVLEHVCKDIHENKIKGRRNLPVSVNFSVQEFYDTNFITTIVDACNRYGVPHNLIQIEVTESTSQTNSFMATTLINRLRELGFRVLMDDFGTGFSNIENLMLIPFDAVKLDRSYIERIVSDSKSRELVKVLINLCKLNKMEVIAEGVDNPQQIKILKEAKCDTIQGYYYSKPIPKAEFDKFIGYNGNPFEKKMKEDNL